MNSFISFELITGVFLSFFVYLQFGEAATILWSDRVPVNGVFGPVEETDTYCQSQLMYEQLQCTNGGAIAVRRWLKLADFPSVYGFNASDIVMGPQGVTIASNWSTYIDGSPLQHSYRFANVSDIKVWMGTHKRCDEWSTSCDQCANGGFFYADSTIFQEDFESCDVKKARMCGCFGGTPLGTPHPTTWGPTTSPSISMPTTTPTSFPTVSPSAAPSYSPTTSRPSAAPSTSPTTSQPTSSPLVQFSAMGPKLFSNLATSPDYPPYQGFSVSLSGNGLTLISAAPQGTRDSSFPDKEGCTFVFHRDSLDSPWDPVPTLLFPSPINDYHQAMVGLTNVISRNGNTIVTCGKFYFSGEGRCVIFARNGTSNNWYQQGSVVGSNPTYSELQGWAVSINDAGTRFVETADEGDDYSGGGWAFSLVSGSWVEDQSVIGSGEPFVDGSTNLTKKFGSAVAMSGAGTRFVSLGTFIYNASYTAIAFWTFDRNVSNLWSRTGSRVEIASAVSYDYDRFSDAPGYTAFIGLALGSNGTLVAVHEFDEGYVHIYREVSGSWVRVQPRFRGTGATDKFGNSLSFSYDCSILAIGDRDLSSLRGGVWLYKYNGLEWVQTLTPIYSSDYSGPTVYQGVSASLSSDGSTLAVGGHFDASGTGAVWPFDTRVTSAPTQSPTTTQPSRTPSRTPSLSPHTSQPSRTPSRTPTTSVPSNAPSTSTPSKTPTTSNPSVSPTTSLPSTSPSRTPSKSPSTSGPSNTPTTSIPSRTPSTSPSRSPSKTPTTSAPSRTPSRSPTTSVPTTSPLVPFNAISESKLQSAFEPAAAGLQGSSVGISGDGLTVVSGAPLALNVAGTSYIWKRPSIGGAWGADQHIQGNASSDNLADRGQANAISRDGSTIVQCGYREQSFLGACWVFVPNGSGGWIQQSIKLLPTGNSGSPFTGYSVAISDDGNTFVAGGYSDATEIGAFWVFVRTGTSWAQQGGKYVPSDRSGTKSRVGFSVAISGNGNTIVVGGYMDNTNIGAVWVYTRSGSTWTQQGTKIVCGLAGTPQFGYGVAVRNDGLMFAASAAGDDSVFVYSYSSVWSVVGTKLKPAGVGTEFGISIAFSLDGNRLAIGDRTYGTSVGGIWMFRWNGSSHVIVGSTPILSNTGSFQGTSVALSSNGLTLVSGAPANGFTEGAAYVFDTVVTSGPTNSPTQAPTPPTKSPTSAPSKAPTTTAPSKTPTTSAPSKAPTFQANVQQTVSLEFIDNANHILNVAEIQVFYDASQSTNSASGMTATSSSLYTASAVAYVASRVNDGSNSTFAHTDLTVSTGTGTKNPWIKIDMGVGSRIWKIVVINRGDANQAFISGAWVRIRQGYLRTVMYSSQITTTAAFYTFFPPAFTYSAVSTAAPSFTINTYLYSAGTATAGSTALVTWDDGCIANAAPACYDPKPFRSYCYASDTCYPLTGYSYPGRVMSPYGTQIAASYSVVLNGPLQETFKTAAICSTTKIYSMSTGTGALNNNCRTGTGALSFSSTGQQGITASCTSTASGYLGVTSETCSTAYTKLCMCQGQWRQAPGPTRKWFSIEAASAFSELNVAEIQAFTALAPNTNAALGASGTMSTEYPPLGTYSITKTTDGDNNTFANTAGTNDATPYMELDLGVQYEIGRIVVINRGATSTYWSRLNNAVVKLREGDNKQLIWQGILSGSLQFYEINWGVTVSVEFTDGAAHYLNVAEIEVFTTSDPLVNVAYGKTATSSSVVSGMVASNVVDGDFATYMNTGNDVNAFVSVSLGGIGQIKQIGVYNRLSVNTTLIVNSWVIVREAGVIMWQKQITVDQTSYLYTVTHELATLAPTPAPVVG